MQTVSFIGYFAPKNSKETLSAYNVIYFEKGKTIMDSIMSTYWAVSTML